MVVVEASPTPGKLSGSAAPQTLLIRFIYGYLRAHQRVEVDAAGGAR
jgi:hypothetical protein